MKTSPLLLVLLGTANSFAPRARYAPIARTHELRRSVDTRMSLSEPDEPALGRRAVLSVTSAGVLASTFGTVAPAIAADKKKGAGSKPKIVVVGGSGFVGAHVAQLLAEKENCDVVVVSRVSPAEGASRAKAKLGGAALPAGVTLLSADAATADLAPLFKGAEAVVSCVGIVPGGKNQRDGNGAVNVRIADAAKAAGVPRFVYISVASAISGGPGKFLFPEYVKGKAEAEAAVVKDYGAASSLVIRPAVIPGGGGPPGPPGIPPVDVDAVAKMVVAGALGRKSGVVDGGKAIDAAVAAL